MRLRATDGDEHLVSADQLVVLRAAIRALHEYIQAKMLAVRDAPDARHVDALLHEYFHTNELAAHVESRVAAARLALPAGAATDGGVAQVLADLTRRGG